MRRKSQWALALIGLFGLTGWNPIRLGEGPGAPTLRFSTEAPVEWHMHSAGYSRLALNRVTAAMESAFRSWEQPCSTLRFTRINGRDGDTPAMDGVSVVRFAERNLPQDVDPQTTLAFASPVGVFCTGIATEVDITFNGVSFDWSDNPNRRQADIETVALHEIGHMLGLDHVNDRNAVMFPSVIERVRRDLSRDELNAVCAIYAVNRGGACTSNRDCGGGEVCQLGPRTNGEVLQRCGPPLGAGGLGARCNSNANFCDTGCANGLCLGDGTCSAYCANDADCNGLTCIEQRDGQLTYGICIDIDLCEDDVDVCPAGQACIPFAHPSEARALRACFDTPGNAGVGAVCADSDTCQGGLCLGGRCSAACDSDADCPDPYGCEPVPVQLSANLNRPVDLCVFPELPCVRPTDCDEGAGLFCQFVANGNQVSTRCLPSDGFPGGSVCQGADDCQSGLCLAEGVCSDSCRGDTDCINNQVCRQVTVSGARVQACVPGDAPPADAGAGGAGGGPGPRDMGMGMPLADAGLGAGGGGGGQMRADVGVIGGVVRREPGSSGGCDVAPSRPGEPLSWAMLGLLLTGLCRRRSKSS